MAPNQAQSTTVPTHTSQSPTWVQTVSGVAVLTLGLQGAAASAVSAPSVSEPVDEITAEAADDVIITVAPAEPIEPAAAQPMFSQWRSQVQSLLQTERPSSAVGQTMVRLENHRRDLHRHSNEVESQLLGLQHLLSIQSYGTSFADRLLDENAAYQAKLQQIQALEADMHNALEQADSAALNQLNSRLQRMDQELEQMAQSMLQQHIEQAQDRSTSGLWQEPMYRESLRWLMQHTHERHLLQVRQQTLAHTLVAIAVD